MISSFFNRAKPIHLVIVSSLLLLVFVIVKWHNLNGPVDLPLFFKQAGLFLICLASVFVFDFLASRNNLTKKNSYRILIFSIFISLLPETLLNSKLLIANLFVLLALRRIISLRTNKEIKKKLFDASFWLCVGALFYFWAILFYILIIAALILYRIVDIKNWIIPFTGILAVVIIGSAFMILTGQDFIHYFQNQIEMSFDFSTLNSQRRIIATTIIFSYGIWSLLYFIRHLKAKSKKSRPSFIVILISIAIGFLVVAVAPNKNGGELLFLFAPLAIIITNYLETVSEKWFKEILLYALAVAPIILLML